MFTFIFLYNQLDLRILNLISKNSENDPISSKHFSRFFYGIYRKKNIILYKKSNSLNLQFKSIPNFYPLFSTLILGVVTTFIGQ